MLMSASSSSLSGQKRPLACGGRTAARLPPLRHHAAASSAVWRPSSIPLPSCRAAPTARIASIPGGGANVGRGLGHGPFAPAQASFVLPAPTRGYFYTRLTSRGHRDVSAAPFPPRSSAAGGQQPTAHQRGKPQQQPNEEDQLPAAADGAEQQYNNKTAGSSAGAAAEGDAAPVPASTPNASAVAAARLLRGALEAALLPRLEAMEGRIVERMGEQVAAAAEAQGQRTKEEVQAMVQVRRAREEPKRGRGCLECESSFVKGRFNIPC